MASVHYALTRAPTARCQRRTSCKLKPTAVSTVAIERVRKLAESSEAGLWHFVPPLAITCSAQFGAVAELATGLAQRELDCDEGAQGRVTELFDGIVGEFGGRVREALQHSLRSEESLIGKELRHVVEAAVNSRMLDVLAPVVASVQQAAVSLPQGERAALARSLRSLLRSDGEGSDCSFLVSSSETQPIYDRMMQIDPHAFDHCEARIDSLLNRPVLRVTDFDKQLARHLRRPTVYLSIAAGAALRSDSSDAFLPPYFGGSVRADALNYSSHGATSKRELVQAAFVPLGLHPDYAGQHTMLRVLVAQAGDSWKEQSTLGRMPYNQFMELMAPQLLRPSCAEEGGGGEGAAAGAAIGAIDGANGAVGAGEGGGGGGGGGADGGGGGADGGGGGADGGGNFNANPNPGGGGVGGGVGGGGAPAAAAAHQNASRAACVDAFFPEAYQWPPLSGLRVFKPAKAWPKAAELIRVLGIFVTESGAKADALCCGIEAAVDLLKGQERAERSDAAFNFAPGVVFARLLRHPLHT